MTNLIGQSFGRYHILEQLGEGGMATVYKTYDTRLERPVALKVILPMREHSEKFLKRFEREAKSLAGLSHPNIVKVLDYGEHEGLPYIVMEYVPGGMLKEKLGKPMGWKEAAKLLAPVARALAYAHSQKMVHRDVKPANILLTQSGEPMLSDFGVAKMLKEEKPLELTGTGTGAGVGVGTPEYMAPEQGMGKEVDGRTDIYSLGIVFYELVTGRKPFRADTALAVLYKQMTEPLPHPKQYVGELPDGVVGVMLKALAKDPKDRYQDAGAFADALDRLARGEVEGVWGEPVREVPKSRRMIWLVGGLIGLVVLGLGIGLGVLLVRRGVEAVPIKVAVSTPTVASIAPPTTILVSTAPPKMTSGGYVIPVQKCAPNCKYTDMTVGFIQTDSSPGWRAANTSSFKETATQLGINLYFYDSQFNIENQISTFHLLNQNSSVNVIVLAALDVTGYDTVLTEAKANGKIVILEDRRIDAAPSNYYTYISYDAIEEGHKAAAAMCDLLKDSAKKNVVEISGAAGASAAIDRAKGFREKIGDCGITITQSQTGNWDSSDSQSVMGAFLRKSTDIQGVFAHNDEEAIGAIQAIDEAGLKAGKDIKVIGVDATADGFKYLISGELNADIECNPLLAPQVYDAALKAMNGDSTLPTWIPAQEGQFFAAQGADALKAILATRKY